MNYKPREWWISFLSGRAIHDKEPPPKWPSIRVVEYSAYEALKAELEQAKAKLVDSEKLAAETGDSYWEMRKQRDEAKAEIEELKTHLQLTNEGWITEFKSKAEADSLKAEIEKWKDEYQNVCKFATQYEEQADSLRLMAESYRAKLAEVGHHLSDIEHSCKRYEEVGKENIAIVKILPALREARKALEGK